VVGQSVLMLSGSPGNEAEVGDLIAHVRRGESVSDFETVRVAKDGRRIAVSLTLSPIRDANGTVIGAASITHEITKRKQAEAALEAANKELEAFSFSVSHDLRAPLRIVDGFSRILVEDYSANLPEEAKRVVQIVRDGTVQMGQLIDDLLNFSRLGRQQLRTRTVDLRSVVDQVLTELSDVVAKRQVEIAIGELPPCLADPALIKQVVTNLVSNAFKYSRARTPAIVQIGALPSESGAREHTYFVKDNGVGFDMAYADKLFGVFQRLHRAEDYEGTGVGLALVQRILHRHGGRIWAVARPDHGATFWFTVPAATPTAELVDYDVP
jgi:light-regulated signal transduction histidine kinase (bacteriophytochrome)